MSAGRPAGLPELASLQKLYLVEVLPNIKIWRLAPNFDIWKVFNHSQYSVEVRRTSTDELEARDLGNKSANSGNPLATQLFLSVYQLLVTRAHGVTS